MSGSRNALNDVDVRVSDVELRRYGTGGQYFMFVTCFAVRVTERAVVNIEGGVARLRIAGYGQGREAEATTTKMVRNQSSGLGTLVLQGDHRITCAAAPEDGSECTWVNKGLGGEARHYGHLGGRSFLCSVYRHIFAATQLYAKLFASHLHM